jgi:hypothetical protein
LFTEHLYRRAEREADTKLAALLSKVAAQFEEALVYTDMYVFCMCAENNLLNQWRVYGRDTVPVSIEFGTRGFLFHEWEPYYFDVVPIVYDTERQNKTVREAIAASIEYASRHEKAIFRSDDSVHAYVKKLASSFVDWSMSMKHPQFEVEKEWRLATRWGSERRDLTGRAFRASPAGIVPYLVMSPKAEEKIDASRLPIRSVTIGPCKEPQVQKRTLHELLYQRGRADAEVRVSNLPIRV